MWFSRTDGTGICRSASGLNPIAVCRLLLIQGSAGVVPNCHLEAFRTLSKNSTEYQGHGWGCAWLNEDRSWSLHHSIKPVWEDNISFPRTTLFLVHARSAFRNQGITIGNNMPFYDGRQVFLFNGELQGVRIKAEGRIGAEKIFNTIKKFDSGDTFEATRRGVMVINRRTRYVRALNFFLADSREVQIYSQFGEDPDYFQLRRMEWNGVRVVCSQTYDFGDNDWRRIQNDHLYTMNLF